MGNVILLTLFLIAGLAGWFGGATIGIYAGAFIDLVMLRATADEGGIGMVVGLLGGVLGMILAVAWLGRHVRGGMP